VLTPLHDQVTVAPKAGKLGAAGEAVPLVQKVPVYAVWATVKVVALLPQAPLIILLAEQFALAPPLIPVQVQVHGPVPEIVPGVPMTQVGVGAVA